MLKSKKIRVLLGIVIFSIIASLLWCFVISGKIMEHQAKAICKEYNKASYRFNHSNDLYLYVGEYGDSVKLPMTKTGKINTGNVVNTIAYNNSYSKEEWETLSATKIEKNYNTILDGLRNRKKDFLYSDILKMDIAFSEDFKETIDNESKITLLSEEGITFDRKETIDDNTYTIYETVRRTSEGKIFVSYSIFISKI